MLHFVMDCILSISETANWSAGPQRARGPMGARSLRPCVNTALGAHPWRLLRTLVQIPTICYHPLWICVDVLHAILSYLTARTRKLHRGSYNIQNVYGIESEVVAKRGPYGVWVGTWSSHVGIQFFLESEKMFVGEAKNEKQCVFFWL